MIDLKYIKARLEAATPGPWKLHFDDEENQWVKCDYPSKRDPIWKDHICQVNNFPLVGQNKKNGTFIAHAPTDIAALVEALEKCKEIIFFYRDFVKNDKIEEMTKEIFGE